MKTDGKKAQAALAARWPQDNGKTVVATSAAGAAAKILARVRGNKREGKGVVDGLIAFLCEQTGEARELKGDAFSFVWETREGGTDWNKVAAELATALAEMPGERMSGAAILYAAARRHRLPDYRKPAFYPKKTETNKT